MASLLTKVLRAVRARRPALTVRHTFDREYLEHRFEVRASTDRRRLEFLGSCGADERDRVLELLREGRYQVDELVEGKSWLCRPEGEPC